MEEILELISSGVLDFQMPDTITQIGATATQYGKFVGILAVGVLVSSSMIRLLLGKANQINMAITAAMEILCLYVLNIVICAFGLENTPFLAPLPFVSMAEGYLFLFPIFTEGFRVLCQHTLKLLIIAFLVNLVGGLIPHGQKLLTWSILRLVTVILSVIVLYAADTLLQAYVPPAIWEYAPALLVLALLSLIALGSMKIFVGAALAFIDPIIAVLYTFFFSNIIGRALAKAVVSTLIIGLLLCLLNWLQITVLPIAPSGLIGYIPLLILVVLLWYFVGRLLYKK